MRNNNNVKPVNLFFLILLFNLVVIKAQPAFTPYAVSDSTIYDVMFQLLDNNTMPTYIAIPFVTPIAKRAKQISNDEGGGFYITEISPDLIYTVFRGRPQGSSGWQRNRLSIVYNPTLRMVVSDNSNPILPTNQKAGFRYDFIFRNKHEEYKFFTSKVDSCVLNFDPKEFTRKKIDTFDTHGLTVNLMHYSNGQTDSVKNDPKINNYRNGDFSTNYVNVFYTFSRLTKNNRIYQFTTGPQWDWGIPGWVLAYTNSQQNRYGHVRWFATFQFNSKPRYYGKHYYDWTKYAPCSVETKKYSKFVVHRLRFQAELILDGVKGYRPDLNQKYRLGALALYEVDFLKWRNVGLFAQLYGGRDYLNIRYDDVIVSATIGFTFRINKIFPVYYHADPSHLELNDSKVNKREKFLSGKKS